MQLAVRTLFLSAISLTIFTTGSAQSVERNFETAGSGIIRIVNLSGRVGVRAIAGEHVQPRAVITGAGVMDGDLKISSSRERANITVTATPAKRVDLSLIVPQRVMLEIQTTTGAIEVNGDVASVMATTETGTISTDIPDHDLKYDLIWTESRPRYLADFELAKVKERSGGRFQLKGVHRAPDKTTDPDPARAKPVEKPLPIDLKFTTARGIVLLNVPPNEVMSDLRERPLTEAAKAIIRSGDSLLMDAIRRAAPKYFGDYARTLPPLIRQPGFASHEGPNATPAGRVKTATVRVTDLKNRAIAGLKAHDFEITESGERAEIMSVEASTAPVNLVLLLDVSGSVENYVNFIRKAARNFIETVDKSDRVAIVIFNDDVKVLSRFTTDKGRLSASLDTFDAGGGTAYYDALAFTIADTLRPLKGERSAIVILTDGEDNRSFLAFDSMAGSIQESGALIYPLYVPSGLIAAAASGFPDVDPLRKKYMSLSSRSQGEGEKLAKLSGGVYYAITEITQIQRAYEDIVRQLRSAYSITFRSRATAVGGTGVSPRLKIRSRMENTFAAVTSVVVKE